MRPSRSLPSLLGLPSLLVALLLTAQATPAWTIGPDGYGVPADTDEAYAAGVAAFEREDWRGVIDHMALAIEARPWNDNAFNLTGFAHRKLGDYPAALTAYDRALTLNPHNRGALEYLGEAYLELDRPEDAKAILDRLADVCRIVATFPADPVADCHEWVELSEAYDAYLAQAVKTH